MSSKVPKAVIYQGLARILDNEAAPPLPKRFYVASPSPGVFKFLQVVDNADPYVVHEVPKSAVAAELSKYVRTHMGDSETLQLTARDADQAIDAWAYLANAVPEPKSFIWPNDEQLAYARLPWNGVPGPTPLFDELFSRMTNAQAVRDWIGSLFDPDADRQQYVWIHGAGNDGKSSLVRFLKRVFGGAAVAASVPSKDDKHWSTLILGRRLVVFPDSNNYGFPASGLFKQFTGGDSVQVNPKHGKLYSADLSCKFLFLSNERPALSSETADVRRAILAEMTSIPGAVDPLYETRLWEEGGAFIAKCLEGYVERCPSGAPIPVERDRLMALIGDEEERYEVVFDRHFTVAPTRRLRASVFQDILTREFRDRHDRREFCNWMRRKHGMQSSISCRIGEHVVKCYVGFLHKLPEVTATKPIIETEY